MVLSDEIALAAVSIQYMIDNFNRLNTTIEAILHLAQPTMNEVCHTTRLVYSDWSVVANRLCPRARAMEC